MTLPSFPAAASATCLGTGLPYFWYALARATGPDLMLGLATVCLTMKSLFGFAMIGEAEATVRRAEAAAMFWVKRMMND